MEALAHVCDFEAFAYPLNLCAQRISWFAQRIPNTHELRFAWHRGARRLPSGAALNPKELAQSFSVRLRDGVLLQMAQLRRRAFDLAHAPFACGACSFAD